MLILKVKIKKKHDDLEKFMMKLLRVLEYAVNAIGMNLERNQQNIS